MNIWNNLIKSIFAGIMIGIGGLVYLNVGGAIGAILFSVGLVVIVLCNFNLYTGKIGYIKTYKEIPLMILFIIGNAIGTFLVACSTNTSSEQLMITKINNPLYMTFIKAIFCGFLMYVCVNIYKEHKKLIGIILCIPAFILCGFEHSIADMFYIFTSETITLRTLLFIIIVIIGNGIGANLHHLIFEKKA